MLDPFLGEIAWVAFDFAPDGWLVCDGRTLPCSQYSALYALLGNRYGGSVGSTFQIPNLLGRTMVGMSTQLPLGAAGGAMTCTLGVAHMPIHNHPATFTPTGGVSVSAGLQGQTGVAPNKLASTPSAGYTLANAADPSGGTPALYAAPGAGASVALGGVAATVTSNVGGAVTVANNGGSQPFSLMQPYLPLLPIIAYVGIFPTKS